MSSWDVAAVHIALSGSCICERASAETRHTHNANCKAVPAAAAALRRDVNSEHALGSALLCIAIAAVVRTGSGSGIARVSAREWDAELDAEARGELRGRHVVRVGRVEARAGVEQQPHRRLLPVQDGLRAAQHTHRPDDSSTSL